MGLTSSHLFSTQQTDPSKIIVAILKKYLPVVTVDFNTSIFTRLIKGNYAVYPKSVTKKDYLQFVQNLDSDVLSSDEFIITTLENAYIYFGSMFYTGHNTTPDFISPGVFIFGSPVFVELTELTSSSIILDNKLTYNDVCNYMNTKNIPLCVPYNNNIFSPSERVYDKIVTNKKIMFTRKPLKQFKITNIYCFDAYGKLIKL